MASSFDLSVRLRTAVEGLNEVSALISEIQDLGGATEESASRSKALSDELRDLQKADGLVDSFRRLKTETASTSAELREAQQEAQRLGRELANSSNPTRKLEKDFEAARKTVSRLKDTQEEQVRALQNQRQELGRAGIDSRKLSQAQVEIRQNMERTSGEVQDLTRDLREARDQTSKQFKDPTDRLERGARTSGAEVEKLGARLRRVAGIAVGSAAAFFGIREAIQGVVGIARVGGEFEILQTRLEALTGSAEEGEKAFEWIEEFTKNTPFQLDQVTDAFVRAKAFGLDPMDGTLQAIADQASKTGGGMESLNGIVTALGQAYSKGKIQAEEMLQLIERGVPAWDLLAEATGRSAAELQKMTTAGELGRREIDLLIQQLGKSSAGAAQSQMQTLQGLVSNLQDTWAQFLNEVANQGLMDYFKNQIRDIARAFEEMRASGELQQWARRISDSIVGMVQAIKTAGATIWEYRDAIEAAAKAWVIYKGAQAAVGLTQFATMIRTTALTAMADMTAQTKAATGSMGKFRAGMKAIPAPVQILAIGAALLAVDKASQAAGDAIADYITKYSESAKLQQANEQQVAKIARDRIASLKSEVSLLEEYRQARRYTSEEAIRMSQEERAEAETRLTKQAELLENELRQLEYFKILGYDVADSTASIGKALDETRAALETLNKASQISGQALENGISAAAQDLINRFDELVAGGDSAAKAIETLFEGFDPGNTTTVREFVEAIGEIKDSSREAGEAIDKELRERLDKMTGAELLRFSITVKSAFEEGSEAAARFGGVVDGIADAALRNIGTTLEELRTGISEAERSALDSFQVFAETGSRSIEDVRQVIGELQDDIKSPEAVDALRQLLEQWAEQSGVKVSEVDEQLKELAEGVKGTSEQIAEELKASIEAAGDEEAIETVRQRIQKLWNDGKISAEAYSTALGQIRDRQREVDQAVAEGSEKSAAKLKELGDQAKETAASADEIRGKFRQAWGDAFGQALTNAREKVTALSIAARNLFEMKIGGNAFVSEADSAAEALQKAEQRVYELDSARQRLMNNSFAAWFADTAIAAAEVERQFYAQAVAMDELENKIQSGAYSLDQLDMIAGNAANRFDLLDDQRLDNLTSAIDTAKARLQQLSDSLGDTISSLRQEIAGLKGDVEEVDRLRYQESQAELQEQLDKARSTGDSDTIAQAEEALRLQEEAYRLQQQQNREQAEAERQQEAQRAAEEERRRQEQERQQREREAVDFDREERNANRQQSSAPARTIVLQGPNGNQARVSVTEDQERSLLDVLEDIGYRSNG